MAKNAEKQRNTRENGNQIQKNDRQMQKGGKQLQKNQTVAADITDIGVNGEGIGKVDGYTLFIKDAVIGDQVEAKITKVKKNYGYARLMKILRPSPDRVNARCAFARQCGGCQIQEMSYEKQLEFKARKVRGNLERIGGFPPELLDRVMEPAVGMDQPFGYRNKAQFPFGTDKEGRPVTGFYAGRTHSIIANTDCALGVPVNREILEIILKYMEENHVPSYDEKNGTGIIRHALIRFGFTTKEIMVCLVINGEKLPHEDRLIEKLSAIKGMTSISVSPNMEQTNVIMGSTFSCALGTELYYRLYRKCKIPDLSSVLLSGESGADGKALLPCAGIRGSEGRRDCVGSLLRNRNHFSVPCAESRAGVRCGDRTPGNRRTRGETRRSTVWKMRSFSWERRRKSCRTIMTGMRKNTAESRPTRM